MKKKKKIWIKINIPNWIRVKITKDDKNANNK